MLQNISLGLVLILNLLAERYTKLDDVGGLGSLEHAVAKNGISEVMEHIQGFAQLDCTHLCTKEALCDPIQCSIDMCQLNSLQCFHCCYPKGILYWDHKCRWHLIEIECSHSKFSGLQLDFEVAQLNNTQLEWEQIKILDSFRCTVSCGQHYSLSTQKVSLDLSKVPSGRHLAETEAFSLLSEKQNPESHV